MAPSLALLAAPQLWERNRNKGIVALLLSLPVAVYLVAAHGSAGVHQLIERAN
jgi:hypothetical protein